jgi:hypothetical protein
MLNIYVYLRGASSNVVIVAYAASQKVAGWILDEVIKFCSCLNPSSHTMVLQSSQPLIEMSIRKLPSGKGSPA